MNPSYFLIALFFLSESFINAYNSFVTLRCFEPAVSLLRHWCRKHACSAKSFGISCFVSGCLICFTLCHRDFSYKVRGLYDVQCECVFSKTLILCCTLCQPPLSVPPQQVKRAIAGHLVNSCCFRVLGSARCLQRCFVDWIWQSSFSSLFCFYLSWRA